MTNRNETATPITEQRKKQKLADGRVAMYKKFEQIKYRPMSAKISDT